MKRLGSIAKQYAPWLLLLLAVNVFSALLLWLSDSKSFETLIGVILLFSSLLFVGILLAAVVHENKKQQLFRAFLSNPDSVNEERLLRAVSQQERETLYLLSNLLRQHQIRLNQLSENLQDYEEYVEGWAHETKTPLSLLTMILDNRADEIPSPLHAKLNYIRSQLQEDITQMLYYARLKSDTKDYRFEEIVLTDLLDEVLLDYAPLLEEKGFVIHNQLNTETVFTDRRGLQFMLGQIISNSIKYSADAPVLTISMAHPEGKNILLLADNGIGVKSYDLPYIFQKGFTGDSMDSRKRATGMGLYLTKKMADDLNLTVDARSDWGKGFEILIAFPEI